MNPWEDIISGGFILLWGAVAFQAIKAIIEHLPL